VKSKDFSALLLAKVRFVEPMYALAVQKLPQGQEWLYEVKFDGYRCLAGRDSTGMTLWSRRGEEMKNCVWLKPEEVAQIEFTEWTPDNHLRHSKFVGLRDDKEAREVVPEIES